jgi:hypothetical protein
VSGIRCRHHRKTMAYSCADRLSGGRNDWFEPGSHGFVEWCGFGGDEWGQRGNDRRIAR